MCSLQCRKPVGHLCCILYCFLFLECLEIQRRNAVLPLSFSQSGFHMQSPRAIDDLCRSLFLDTCTTVHQACFPSLHNWDVVYLIPGVAIRRGPCIQPPWMLFEHSIGQNHLMLQAEVFYSCSPASFVYPKPYSPTADDIVDGSLLLTLALKSPITSSMSLLGTCLTAWDKFW